MKNLVIDINAIKSNIRVIKEHVGGATVYADLSANACGMGLLETAKILRDEGIRSFAVSDPRDAQLLRSNGFADETIMMLRSTADAQELSQLIDLGVVCTVGSYDAGVAINGLAEARRTVCEVQIKIDTGLGRYGFSSGEIDKISSVYKYMSNLAIVGVFTTLSESTQSSSRTENQMAVFTDMLEKIRALGFETGIVHVGDSAAPFTEGMTSLNAVRVDHALAGRIPGKTVSSLTKVGYIEAGIEEVGWFPKGHCISGGSRLNKAARLAVLSVGFYHGFGAMSFDKQESFWSRLFFSFGNRNFVRIDGHKARVMGHIGMMHTIIDVTNINCSVGDIAIMDVDPLNVKELPIVYRPSAISASPNQQ